MPTPPKIKVWNFTILSLFHHL